MSYADDTNITFYGNSWDETFVAAQEGFNVVQYPAINIAHRPLERDNRLISAS